MLVADCPVCHICFCFNDLNKAVSFVIFVLQKKKAGNCSALQFLQCKAEKCVEKKIRKRFQQY